MIELSVAEHVMSIFSSLLMGCLCGKETVTVQNRKFHVKSRLAEGYISAFGKNTGRLHFLD